jgi:hypothetical protein
MLTLQPEDQQMGGLVLAMNLRQSARRRVFLPARVQPRGTTAALDCTVVDLSDTGARLAFGHSINLPGEIEIELSKTHQSVRAAVIWQRENTCGVHFVQGTLARPAGQSPAPSQQRQVA